LNSDSRIEHAAVIAEGGPEVERGGLSSFYATVDLAEILFGNQKGGRSPAFDYRRVTPTSHVAGALPNAGS
jgi:hypothetical protein